MNWQKRQGYGLRALGETAMARVKRLNGGKLNARTFQSQQTEIAMQIDALNRSIRAAKPKHNQDPLTNRGMGDHTIAAPCTKALWFGLYTGMRRDEVLTLRWERVDMAALTFRVEETKTGVPLELPVTGHLRAILERRQSESEDLPADRRNWVFPSPTSASGHVEDPHHLYGRISENRRREVLVPRPAQLFHYRRRARADAAVGVDEAAGQSCPSQ